MIAAAGWATWWCIEVGTGHGRELGGDVGKAGQGEISSRWLESRSLGSEGNRARERRCQWGWGWA